MVKLLSLASAAVVALVALSPSGASAVSTRALLAETAPSPMAAPATAIVTPASSASADMTLAADGVSFANGKLVVKDPSDTLIKRSGNAFGLASTAATFRKVNAPSEAVVIGVSADGSPLTALARLSNPVLTDDELTFDAVILAAPAAGSGAVAATAAKAGASLVSPTVPSFKAKTAAVVFDGADAAAAAGDKSIVGAAIGAGVGTFVCGPWCGAGGAMTGAWWF
jgi:hypothetical protein